MEPPAKRTKFGLHERPDDEANNDELSMTPSQFAARQDPLYELDKGRAKAASKLKFRFENIFEKYAQDFDGVGDEINLHTGEVTIDNGHLKSLKDDEEKELQSGDEEEQEEERIRQPKRQPSQALSLPPGPPPPALSPAHNAAVAFLQQSGWTPPPGFNADLSSLSGLSTAPQLFSTPNPPGFANSLFGPGSAPTDPLWQTPELPFGNSQGRLGSFGTEYTLQDGQRRALSQLFAHPTQRKTTSARDMNLKRKNLLEGTLAEGDKNSKQDGETGDSVINAGDHDGDEDDPLLGVSPTNMRPAPLPKKAAQKTAAPPAVDSLGSAKVKIGPLVSQDKTRGLQKSLKKNVESKGKKTSAKQPGKSTGTIGKRRKAAIVPPALPAPEDENKPRDAAASTTTESVRKKRGRPPKLKGSVATRVQKMQPEKRNHDASALADRTSLNEPEPEPIVDALPEIHPEMWDEEAINAQLMQAVNEALVLVTSPMKSWPEASSEKELAKQRGRPANDGNGLAPEPQDTGMFDAVTPNPKAIANGHWSPGLPVPAGMSTKADESASTSHLKKAWTRNRADPSFAFSDDEDEVDFQQSWGPPGDNMPDLFTDVNPEAPALATGVAGAADPDEDRAAVPMLETCHHELGREESWYVDTAQEPPSKGVAGFSKSSSAPTLEITHSPSQNVEAEAEVLALEISAKSNGMPTANEPPEDKVRDNAKAQTPPPRRRGRPSHKGHVPNARATEASLEAPTNSDGMPTAVETVKGDTRENKTSRAPPPERRGRTLHKGRVPKARTSEPTQPPSAIAGSAKDRAAEPQSPPTDFSSLPRDRITEENEPPSTSHSAPPRPRNKRGTSGHRKDRLTGSDKNLAPTAERSPSQTLVQEGTQAEPAKASLVTRSKRRRSTLTSLVPDLSDDDVDDEAGMVGWRDTPASSSFTSSHQRAAARTAHPSPKTPLHATSRRHGLMLGSARLRPSPASATTPVAGSSAAARRRISGRPAGGAHNSPLLERVLKTTPRDGGQWDSDQGGKGAVASGDITVRTPNGAVRRCGVDGFVCARDFCFTCCK